MPNALAGGKEKESMIVIHLNLILLPASVRSVVLAMDCRRVPCERTTHIAS